MNKCGYKWYIYLYNRDENKYHGFLMTVSVIFFLGGGMRDK